MSGIYGYSLASDGDHLGQEILGGLEYWNRIYGSEAHGQQQFCCAGLGCHVEHFSDRYPHGTPILQTKGRYAVVDALLYNREELLPMDLFPKESDSGLEVDVPHAEEVLNFAVQYLNAYFAYISDVTPQNLETEKMNTRITLGKGYAFLSKCYEYGNHVSRNRDRAEQYKRIAAKMYIFINE